MKKPFKELDEDRKWDIVTDMVYEEWYEDVISQFTKEMEKVGFSDVKVSFSGFGSQVDGARFTAYLDFEEFFGAKYHEMDFTFTRSEWEEDEELAELADILPDPHFFIRDLTKLGFFSAKLIRNSSRYVHENSVGWDFVLEGIVEVDYGVEDIERYEFNPDQVKELEQFVIFIEPYLKDWKNDVCKKLYDRLEKDYEAIRKELLNQYEEENEEWNVR